MKPLHAGSAAISESRSAIDAGFVNRDRRRQLAAAWVLIGLALGLRFYRLSFFSLWLDEILEAYWIRGSSEFFWSALKFDGVHPPLDYLIARSVDRLHPAEAWRKIPDVVFGVVSIAACYRLLLLRAGQAIASATAALLAVAPFHVRYSQEYRPHVLGLCLAIVGLLALEVFLRKPNEARLLLLFVASLATAYTLYLGAVVLGVAAIALLLEDALAEKNPGRRLLARRCLMFLPVFVLLLWVAYLPWWPVIRDVAHRASPVGPEPLSLARLKGELSFFSVGGFEGDPLRFTGILYGLVAVVGGVLAFRRPGLRFVPAWFLGSFLCIEVLGRIHPHWYAPRRLLCAAPALTILVTIALVAGWRRRALTRALAAAVGIVLLFGMAGGLRRYYTEGRRDWRPLAAFLARTPKAEEVFTENQWTQLCLAYYLDGPDWLERQTAKPPLPVARQVSNLDGEVVRLTWSWKPGLPAWVVLGGAPERPALREWTNQFQSRDFPEAEGRARLVLLAPDRRDLALAR